MDEPHALNLKKQSIPIFWINLNRAARLKRCMEWALAEGGWENERFDAIDARNKNNIFIAYPRVLDRGSRFPGGNRFSEPDPLRRTTRPELACLASWQKAILKAAQEVDRLKSPYILFMEDDVGSSLAVPDAWPVQIEDLIHAADKKSKACNVPWTLIQLAPISSKIRSELHHKWRASNNRSLLVPKEEVRSHGNGAVLLNQRALKYLVHPSLKFANRFSSIHLLPHPWQSRPVADKWIYASVPPKSVYVACYPLFCLEAKHSELHPSHVGSFHQLSRDVTMDIWAADGMKALLNAYAHWQAIS